MRFVSCSATIAKPLSHMQTIFGLEEERIEVVTDDGAPSGSKECLIWENRRSISSSPLMEAVTLMIYLMKQGIRVILFCKVSDPPL